MNDKPKIYAFCNGGGGDWWNMLAISEDGVVLGGHVCSSPSWGPHDMGVVGDWKHDAYTKYYPQGFEVVWIEDARTSEELDAAHKLHVAMTAEQHHAKLVAANLATVEQGATTDAVDPVDGISTP